LARRLAKQLSNYKSWLLHDKKYMTSFEIIINNNYEVILIENYPCKTKDELHARERYWIENNNDCVNKTIPTRTDKDYRNDNADKYKTYQKEYRHENADKIREKNKQYRIENVKSINNEENIVKERKMKSF
jgi:hypothetical protein